MCTRLCVEICFYFSSKYLEVKLLSCVVSVYLTLWETAKWFPKRLRNFAFPQEMQRSSSCFISSPNFGATSLFICSHSIGCGTAISHYYFNFASDIEHLFLFPGRLHILCFVTCLIKSFAHLKNWVAYLFFLLYVQFLYISREQVLCHRRVLQISVPVCGPPFHFLHAVFWKAEVFIFDVVQL